MNLYLFRQQKQYSTVSLEVGKAQHKYVIGSKRSTIYEILQRTGVSVEMPPPDSPSETITLRGPPGQLGTALNLVHEKASSFSATSLHAPDWIHKYVVGKKGSNIQRITANYPKVRVTLANKQSHSLMHQSYAFQILDSC